MKEVTEIVARHYGTNVKAMKSESRVQPIVRARQMAMYILRKVNYHGATEVGRFFNRDHSTVTYAVKIMDDEIRFDRQRMREYNQIRLSLYEAKLSDRESSKIVNCLPCKFSCIKTQPNGTHS